MIGAKTAVCANGALGPEVNGTLHVDVSPVNDAPINVLPSDPQVAQEDQPFVIQSLQVKDVDLSGWNLSGSSSHDMLQSMLDQHSLIIQHP